MSDITENFKRSQLDTLVASPSWEWRSGMRTDDGRIVSASYGGWLTTTVHICGAASTGLSAAHSPENRPDLDHGGTRGEMLDLARELYCDPSMHVVPVWDVKDDEPVIVWRVFSLRTRRIMGEGPTEGFALVDTLIEHSRSVQTGDVA